jgi:hydroxymethylpyrimidine pyrophosphatase-like HAD family hydrolase
MGREVTAIAIDYHGTYSEDLDGFRAVVKLLQSRGHTCILVTGINDGTTWAAEIKRNVADLMPIVFANGAWKEEAALRAGFKVDVWWDDHPEGIRKPTPEFMQARDKYTEELGAP